MGVKKNGKMLLYTGIMLAMFLLAVILLFGRQLFPGVWAYSDYYAAVTVEKIWDDAEDPSQRPTSVSVMMGYLDSDGKHSLQSIVLSEENNWSYTFPTSWDVAFDKEANVDGYLLSGYDFVSDGNGGYVCKIVNSRKYPVSYQWTWEGLDKAPSYPSLPYAKEYGAGATVKVDTDFKEGTVRKVNDTYYMFSGWDRENFSMPKEAVVIHGQWIKAPLYQVDYQWSGLPEDATLDDGSKAVLPKTATGLPEGQYYNIGYAYQKNTYATAADGTVYQFSGWRAKNWDAYTGTHDFYMPAQDITFIGEWNAVPAYTVRYQWCNAPDDMPENVYLPSAQKYIAGETIVRDKNYQKGDVKYNSKTETYYVFSGWRMGAYDTEDFATECEERFVMPERDVVLYGCWEKTNAYRVRYNWSWEGISNPDYVVIDGRPYYLRSGGSEAYTEGVSVSRDNTMFTAGMIVSNKGQLYRFSGWTAHKQGDANEIPFTVHDEDDSFLMPGYDLMIEGRWEKVEEQAYQVDYQWTGLPDGLLNEYNWKLSLPKSERPYVPGEAVKVNADTFKYSYYNATEANPYMLGDRAFLFSGWRHGEVGTPEFDLPYGETFTMPAEDITLYGSLEEMASYQVEWYEIPSADADVSTAKLMYDRNPNPSVRYVKNGSHVAVKEADKKVRRWTFVEDYSANVLEADTSLEEPATLKLYFTKAPEPEETYNLIIHYMDEKNNKIHADYTEADLAEGDVYSVTSPSISGYVLKDAAQATVSGEMPNHDVELYVVYTPNPEQPNPPTPIVTYTVTYTDGVAGEVVFPDQVTSNLFYGEKTPLFKAVMRFADNQTGVLFHLAESQQNLGDIPVREGYVFTGWTPAVSETVTGDAVYTATWKQDTTDIGDDEPPLVDVPDDEPPLVDVPDDKPPLADTPKEDVSEKKIPQSGTPKTGDRSDISLWMLTLAAAGTGFVYLMRKLHRRREDV